MKNNGKAMAKAGKKTFLRLIRTIFGFFPVLLPLVLIGILFNAIVGSIPAVFMQKVIAVVEQNWQSGDWNGSCVIQVSFLHFMVWHWRLLSSITGKWLR